MHDAERKEGLLGRVSGFFKLSGVTDIAKALFRCGGAVPWSTGDLVLMAAWDCGAALVYKKS